MNEVEGKVVEILDALAAKLGVAGEYLWEVIVRQQLVEAVLNVVTAFIFLGLTYSCLKLARWGLSKDAENNYDEAGPIAMICGWVGVATFAFIVVLCSYYAVGQFINPEYYALKDIFEMLK